MSSFRAGGNPGGMICPGCSRSHFPFCGRAPGFPPNVHGQGPMPVPLHHQHLPNVGSSSFFPGHHFNRPLSPPRGFAGQLEPNYGRHEGFLEQPGLQALHGPQSHSPLPGHSLPSAYDVHGFDRLGTSVGVVAGGGGGSHMGRLANDGRNVGNSWLIEEEREREREKQRNRESQRNRAKLWPSAWMFWD